jgi:uncharacterized SAM-binding protein YcdF (DUF218 family)
LFFVLSKLLDVLLSPLAWAMLLLLAGFWRRPPRRVRRLVRALPAAGMLLLYVSSLEPVANAVWRATEAPPITTEKADVRYDAVVVLGGMVEDKALALYGMPAYNGNIERLMAARELMVHDRARFVLLSGGDGHPAGGGEPEARILARQLVEWGVDPARIVVEDESRNTRENAVESARVIRREGWRSVLLVTSAFHMRRALGCFRAVGLEVDTLSVDFRGCACPMTAAKLLPRTGALDTNTAALRELFGRLVYRVRGYSVPID